MKKVFIFTTLALIAFGIIVLVFKINSILYANLQSQGVACTMEAKICPDGSSVGRTGHSCEFAACPESSTATTSTAQATNDITLAIGQKGKVGDLVISVNHFVQDSRCSIDVTCIQAGAVTVNITTSDTSHTQTQNISSNGVAVFFESHEISITNVTPARQSKINITPDQYRITFHIQN